MIGRIFVRFSPAPLGGRSQGYTPGLAQMPFTTEQAKRKGYINVLAGGWIGKIDWHPESKSVPIKKDMYYGKSPAEKSPAEKSYAEKSPAASDGRGFFSVCDSRFFYTTGILYIL